MTEDLLLSRHRAGWSARFALRVGAAVDLTGLAGYHELATGQRYERARAEDIDYLTRLSTMDIGCAFEFRWLAGDPVTMLVLGRVLRESRAAAETAADRARAALATLPAHVRWEPVTGPAEIQNAFVPFRVDSGGIVEVRRPCLLAEPRRPDARVTTYLAVPPLCSSPQRWPALLALLAGTPTGTMLSVGIEPFVIGPDFATMLASIADRYGDLARPGQVRLGGGLYSGTTWLAADPFAVYAEPLYRDAARRYRHNVFRLRVTVAAAGPLDGRLTATVADLLSAGFEAGCVVEAPGSPMDLGVLLDSVAGLGVPSWGGHEVWRSQPRALRLLTELADPTEVAAAVWLPAAANGTVPGLPTVAPHPDARPLSGGVHFHDSIVGIGGDVVGGDMRGVPEPVRGPVPGEPLM